MTVVDALAWLFELVGFAGVEESVAVLTMLDRRGLSALATIVTVTSLAAPALTVPIAHVTVVVPEQVLWLAVADTSVTPAGSGSGDTDRGRGARPGVVDGERVGEIVANPDGVGRIALRDADVGHRADRRRSARLVVGRARVGGGR